jgi:hypothetical protein
MTKLSAELAAASKRHRQLLQVASVKGNLFYELHDAEKVASDARKAAADAHDEAIVAYITARQRRRDIDARVDAFKSAYDVARKALDSASRGMDDASSSGDEDRLASLAPVYAAAVIAFDELVIGARAKQNEQDEVDLVQARVEADRLLAVKDAAKENLDAASDAARKAEGASSAAFKEYQSAQEDAFAAARSVGDVAFGESRPTEGQKALRTEARARQAGTHYLVYPNL